jgi:hypothetical protein
LREQDEEKDNIGYETKHIPSCIVDPVAS